MKEEFTYTCRHCGKECVSFECDCKKDKTLWNFRARKIKRAKEKVKRKK